MVKTLPEIIAHRGSTYLAPENTLSAFRNAIDLGADGVEMDVQQTRDHGLIIHHDYLIDIGTELSAKIYDLTVGELRSIDLTKWNGVSLTTERLATLDEALACLDADREFLTRGGVFTDDAIDAYIALRQEEMERVRMTPHPVEFELYYSV